MITIVRHYKWLMPTYMRRSEVRIISCDQTVAPRHNVFLKKTVQKALSVFVWLKTINMTYLCVVSR